MISKEFYLKNIFKKIDHVIGGSVSIKKQIPSFRMNSDLDIMIGGSDLNKISKLINLKKSNYGNGIFSFIFEDDSKIDFIVNNNIESLGLLEINDIKYLSVKEIVKFKFDLIEKCIRNKSFNEHNKHLKDLIFINKNYV